MVKARQQITLFLTLIQTRLNDQAVYLPKDVCLKTQICLK